jgi:3-oxoacyl-[acyl-carrier protein] reductase
MLEGRVILVTGSGRGVGAGIARQLARHGATVAVNYSVSAREAQDVVDEISTAGGKARAYQADVRDLTAVQHMVAAVESDFGGLDGVVNNAIAGVQEISLDDAVWSHYANAFDFGCKAVVNTMKASRPAFARRSGGRVVNVVTDYWNIAPESQSVYLSGKGAMVGMSRSLARELGPENITVNMVAPGWMVESPEDEMSAHSREFSAALPLRRRGHPEDVGDVCAFYFSDLGAFVTGAYLLVAGGRVTQAGN